MRFFIALACTMLLAGTAHAQAARDRAIVLMSENPQTRAAQERIGWADAVIIDGTIYISGVVAVQATDEATPEAGFVRAFERLGAILKRAGAGWGDVVEIRSYHTDPQAQIETFSAVKSRYIKPPHPAWTAVGTTQLLQPRGVAEISLVARLATRP